MAKYAIEKETLDTLADVISEKSSSFGLKSPAQMIASIPLVYENGISKGIEDGFKEGYSQGIGDGREIGYNNGYDTGYMQGQEEGYEAGKKAEYDEFWDTFQDNGNRSNYAYAFAGGSWTLKNFKPKYDLIIGNNGTNSMFYSAFTREAEPVDLVEVLNNLGIILDTSGAINTSQDMFYNAKISHIGVIDASNRNVNMFSSCFRSAYIKRIDLVKLAADGSQAFSNTFNATNHPLEYIRFEGCIGQNISFYYCANLDYDSLQSIISCLMDFTGTTTTRTLTLHADAKARISGADIVTITQKGWSLA